MQRWESTPGSLVIRAKPAKKTTTPTAYKPPVCAIKQAHSSEGKGGQGRDNIQDVCLTQVMCV